MIRKRYRIVEICRGSGLGIPVEWLKPIEDSILVGWSGLACIMGWANIPYLPGYLEIICKDVEKVIERFRELGCRIYHGKNHITVSDGIYSIRIWLYKPRYTKLIPIHIKNIRLYLPPKQENIQFIKQYGTGKRNLKHVK